MEFKVVLNVTIFFQLVDYTLSVSSLWFKGTLFNCIFARVCTWLFHKKIALTLRFGFSLFWKTCYKVIFSENVVYVWMGYCVLYMR